MSSAEAREAISAAGKFKARSHDTTINTHIPELEARQGPFNIVLLGDSMLERLKTTGILTNLAQLESTFNAGVGGDKIENVLYRLGTLDMIGKLADRAVKLWIIMIGTNNLKQALKPKDIELYRLLIQTLLKISSTRRVIVCELFKRRDIDDAYVNFSNKSIRIMIDEVNEGLGGDDGRITWVAAP